MVRPKFDKENQNTNNNNANQSKLNANQIRVYKPTDALRELDLNIRDGPGDQRLDSYFNCKRTQRLSPSSSDLSNDMQTAYLEEGTISTPSEAENYQSSFARRYLIEQKREKMIKEQLMKIQDNASGNQSSECDSSRGSY